MIGKLSYYRLSINDYRLSIIINDYNFIMIIIIMIIIEMVLSSSWPGNLIILVNCYFPLWFLWLNQNRKPLERGEGIEEEEEQMHSNHFPDFNQNIYDFCSLNE